MHRPAALLALGANRWNHTILDLLHPEGDGRAPWRRGTRSFSIMVSTVKKYLKPVEEVRSVLAFDRALVNHLTIRNTLAPDWKPGEPKLHDYLAWTELDWSEEETGRTVHNASRRVVLYDLTHQSAISMDRPAPPNQDHQVSIVSGGRACFF